MNYPKFTFWLASALLICTTAFAKSSTPEDLAKEYFAAMQTEGMASTGRFMHPKALSEFKAMLMPVYEAEANSGQRQLMDITFGKDMGISALEEMAPAAFMNGFMNLVATQLGDVKISFDRIEVLGTVEEGNARHVLTRMTVGAGDLAVTQFEVLSFLPYNDSWRLQLNGEMKGLAKTLRTQISGN